MKLGVLFSGGKDSVFACSRAMEKNQVACLITLVSENPDSYMFHTPNIRSTDLQAEALGQPRLVWPTHGRKEEELEDLTAAIAAARDRYAIQGIVTGAIESVYQAARVQRICRDLGLWCFCPLWQTNQVDYLRLLLKEGYCIIISGVYAYPFDASWLGAVITEEHVSRLQSLQKKYKINPSGEGGEIETFVLDGPIFHRRIEIQKSRAIYANYRGHFVIDEMRLADKPLIKKGMTSNGESAANIGSESNGKSASNGDPIIHETRMNRDGAALLVDLCSDPDSLSRYEFVNPIRDFMHELGHSTRVIHYSQITPQVIDRSKSAILCGTALKDNDYAEHLDVFSWIKIWKKPMLGICAGMQVISAVYGGSIVPHPSIGLANIEVLQNSMLLGEPHSFEGYHLHNYAATLPNNFELLAGTKDAPVAFCHKSNPTFGIIFHPEVRNRWILKRFADLSDNY